MQYHTDLPPIVPIITQFNTSGPAAARAAPPILEQGRHPDQTSDAIGGTGNTLGPVVLTMAAEMKHRLGVGYPKDLRLPANLLPTEGLPRRLHPRPSNASPTWLDPPTNCSSTPYGKATSFMPMETEPARRVASAALVVGLQQQAGHGLRHPHRRRRTRAPSSPGHSRHPFRRLPRGRWPEDLRRPRSRQGALQRPPAASLQGTPATSCPPGNNTELQALSALLREAIDLAKRREEQAPEDYGRRAQDIEDRLDELARRGNENRRRRSARIGSPRPAHPRSSRRRVADVPARPWRCRRPTTMPSKMLRPAVITRKVGGLQQEPVGGPGTQHSVEHHGELSPPGQTLPRPGPPTMAERPAASHSAKNPARDVSAEADFLKRALDRHLPTARHVPLLSATSTVQPRGDSSRTAPHRNRVPCRRWTSKPRR